jgi:cytochrome c oxidase cbb3-type subunit I/II
MKPGSIMPNYPHLLEQELDFASIPARVRAMVKLGVPYTADQVDHAEDLARAQARAIIDEIVRQTGPEAVQPGWETRKVTALVAYLQRLGTDLYATPPAEPATEEPAHAAR